MAARGPLRLGILASGTGTNFEAIADAVASGRVDATIGVVVCNRRAQPPRGEVTHRNGGRSASRPFRSPRF
jgi:folate-dependent phosphoribosylglycinamide formyltransferase PurN